MIEQLSKTKVWNEFVEWATAKKYQQYCLVDKENWNYTSIEMSRNEFSDRELLSLLVEFCDSKGYYMTITLNMFFVFDYRLMTIPELHLPYFISEYDYSTRTEATQAAIVKCFELMDGKI